MKILYAIQGTGNGHLSRAVDIIPELKKFGSLDLFVSGSQADITLPYPVKYKSKGLSFYFGKSGGINFLKTFQKNSSKDVIKEINSFPVEKYDLVVNDFEPITAWACKKKEIKCISLSHQSALLSKKIEELTSHLKKHLKDKHSRRGLLQMVADRRTHLKYLEGSDKKRYSAIVKKLNLKK